MCYLRESQPESVLRSVDVLVLVLVYGIGGLAGYSSNGIAWHGQGKDMKRSCLLARLVVIGALHHPANLRFNVVYGIV